MTAQMTVDNLFRLPGHPDWKYELFDSELVCSYRPRPVSCARSTVMPVSGAAEGFAGEPVSPANHEAVREFLVSVWDELLPYRHFDTRGEAAEEICHEFERYLWHLRNGFEVLPGFRRLRRDEERPWLESSAASG